MFTSPNFADSVVRAAAWDDGGTEFVFADGTILSFVDNMNTFVGVRSTPSLRHEKRTETQASHQRKEQGRRPPLSPAIATVGDYVDSVDDPQGDVDGDCELCFTAWTLSKDASKVRAALHIFNSLSERPRLLTTLLTPEGPIPPVSSSVGTRSVYAGNQADPIVNSCGVWQEQGPPINTLLLERRADLLQRHVVFGTVNEWAPTAGDAPQRRPAAPHTALSSVAPSKSSLSTSIASPTCVENTTHSERSSGSSVLGSKDVPVGTVLELWCALRRVCMRVAVHRETFTVRWPAPVTRPDGSRIPPLFHARDAPASHQGSSSLPSWSPCVPQSGPASAPVLFTYVEQTFPVRDPPDAWQVMLQLALELETEALEAEKKAGEDPPPVASSAPTTRTWQGCLPEPHHWSGALNHNRNCNSCRFSALTASQAAHLVAPRTARAVAAMRALHPPSAQLRWMYQANYCSADRAHPPAVYWCLRGPAVSSCPGENSSRRGLLPNTSTVPPPQGTHVVAWVGEDGSVVRANLEWKGYTITHHRLSLSLSCATPSTPAVYRLQAHDAAAAVTTADKRLPPRIAPLRCHIAMPPQVASVEADNGGKECTIRHAVSSPAMPHCDCSNTNVNFSSHDASKNDDSTAIDAPQAETPAPAGGESWVMAVINPQSLRCVSGSFTDTSRRGHPAVTVQPSCPCPALATLTATSLSGEQHFYNCINTNSSPGALPLAPLGTGVCCGKVTPLETLDAARRSRRGGYLSSVVDVAVQLSQVNCTDQRGAGATRPSTDHPPLAAYCGAEQTTTPSSSLPFSPSSSPWNKGFYSAAQSRASRSVSASSVVYLTSRLDGIGTFTALTNGTIRVHFDDRTLLTLIPGVNELDEAQLLVTCVLRNATRCTMRAAQCHPGHAIHRYLVYALPFRRYVYWRAVHPCEASVIQGMHAGESVSEEHEAMLREQPPQRQAQGGEAVVGAKEESSTAGNGATLSLTSLSAMGPPHQDDSECLLRNSQSCSLATSFSPPDAVESVATVLGKTNKIPEVNSAPLHCDLLNTSPSSSRVRLSLSDTTELQGTLHDSGPAWGLADTWRTVQAYDDGEEAEASLRCARLQALLDRNEALSHATRALLRD
ncbi:hypothetical protein JKF63_02307 [Porcisia hertigi]|uniref:C5orf34-like C-terminal domain-containing protein n=1 Tax=Porcisia hertigi TaxID=2761500 RepID=A0A836H7T2_9TRYP|nr:hypothetical protein JKF63_02307 [Porcisia hertigi]